MKVLQGLLLLSFLLKGSSSLPLGHVPVVRVRALQPKGAAPPARRDHRAATPQLDPILVLRGGGGGSKAEDDTGGGGVDAAAQASGPLAELTRAIQQSIYYVAPALAAGHFLRNSFLRKRMQTATSRVEQHEGDLKLLDETVHTPSPPPRTIFLKVVDSSAIRDLAARSLGQVFLLVLTTHLIGKAITSQATCGGALENKILRNLVDFVVCFTVVFCGSRLGGFLRFRMDMDWYRRVLRKPSWTPPPPTFPIIWTPLFTMQAWAYFHVWRAVGRKAASPPLLLFIVHKVLGDLWNTTFFGQKRIGAGLSVMYAFYGALCATCYAFYIVAPKAAFLLLPTAGWVFVATALNYSIWLLNGREPRYPYTEVIQYM